MLDQPRFKVATTEGYLTLYGPDVPDEPGLSAYVFDTRNCRKVVGDFRSETRIPRAVAKGGFVDGPIRGREGAIREAERLAGFLNSVDA